MSSNDYLNNTTARIELMGIPNIVYPFSQFTSASRAAMYTHHLSQAMILDNPEFNHSFTGVEEKLIEYTFNHSRREHDCEIVAVIPKYEPSFLKNGISDCPIIYVITLTLEPNGVRHLDYFTIDKYFMGTNGFGFVPIAENLHRIKPGEILDKGTQITHSPAVQGNQYSMGTNLNIVYGTFPETIEDAFIISESAAKKLQTTQVSQLMVNCRQDRRPLNLNGDEYVDKFLPDIGTHVREDGALCAFRPVHWTTIIADTDPKALREPLHLQDDIIYIEPGAKIVDITFNVNRQNLNNCYPQAEQYMRNNTKCWEGIYRTYLKYKGRHKLTPNMSTLVTTAIYRMIAQGARVPSLEDDFEKKIRNVDLEGSNRQSIDFLQAIVTYTVPRSIHNGDKLSDRAGGKGVVGKIYPDDWMPVDEDGIRADMWIDMNSPVGRNNPGGLYECGIGRISEFVRREVKKTLEESGSEPAFDKLMDWYHDVNPNYEARIREVCTTPKTRKGIVADAIETSPKIWIPPFLDTLTPEKDGDLWNALQNISKWKTKWKARSSRIRYKTLQADGSGKEFTSIVPFAIGPKYIIILHKIPEVFAPGPASVNHIGIPTKSTYETKHYPVSLNPYRFGEDEIRVMMADTDIKELTRFQNLNSNSPTGVNVAIKTILLADKPTTIKRMPISNGDLAKTNVVLNLAHGIAATLGVETKNTKIEASYIPAGFEDVELDTDIVGLANKVDDIFKDTEGPSKRSSSKRSKIEKMIDAMEEDED